MRALRVALGAAGAAVAAYGLLRLVQLPLEQVPAILLWVVGGVAVHDGLIAPLVVAAGVLLTARSPVWLRTPLLRALVVLGPLTLVAVPVLGRFGAKADNPTLLDRPYLLGYAALVVVGVVLTAASAVRARRLATGPGTPAPPP